MRADCMFLKKQAGYTFCSLGFLIPPTLTRSDRRFFSSRRSIMTLTICPSRISNRIPLTTFICNLRRASATDALTSGRLAEQNGRPPDNPNSVLQLDHHDIMLGDPLEDCVSRYCIVHDHGLPFVWFPLGTDDRAP